MIQGLGIIYRNNEIRVGLYNTQGLNRYGFEQTAKACKLYSDNKDNYSIVVKYFDSQNLSIYTRDKDLKEETLCVQFNNIPNFENYFMTMSASDDKG